MGLDQTKKQNVLKRYSNIEVQETMPAENVSENSNFKCDKCNQQYKYKSYFEKHKCKKTTQPVQSRNGTKSTKTQNDKIPGNQQAQVIQTPENVTAENVQ